MDYKLYPPVKEIEDRPGVCVLGVLEGAACSAAVDEAFFGGLPAAMRPQRIAREEGYGYRLGKPGSYTCVEKAQGYTICIAEDGIAVQAADLAGLRYGLDTLAQLVAQAQDGSLACLQIRDYPTMENRGLMLDVSRGKVYTRAYLLGLVELLGRMRYNILQLYVEHTFDFKTHPDICRNSDPLTAEDILAVQAHCKRHGIELQANLQSLGHCNRILTRPAYQHLAESEMYWSLCTTSEDSIRLLEELYSEYLPLFENKWLNVCMDEPYDIGRGQSASSGKSGKELYSAYLLKIHDLAARFGKRVMAFGDFFCRHPELIEQMPEDMVYLDWCYDPKPVYGTPALFKQNKMPFWVCPGSGNWNTLFPRLEGGITNIVNLTMEGIGAGALGMLFTDWNDHGAYAQPGPGYYLYAYAAAVSWGGCDPGKDYVDGCADWALSIPGYSHIIRRLAEIYRLPPIWSKNRSECVMALFDEPIFGNALRGPEPPAALKAYDLALPEGIEPVFERHSQHPLRPYFRIPEETCRTIQQIVAEVSPLVAALEKSPIQRQLSFILDAFLLATDKLALSRKIISAFANHEIDVPTLIGFEDELRLMVRRYVHLQLAYVNVWTEVANMSELDISMTYFAHIIERLDYLRNWLSLNREKLGCGQPADVLFATYETAGYGTLPTY